MRHDPFLTRLPDDEMGRIRRSESGNHRSIRLRCDRNGKVFLCKLTAEGNASIFSLLFYVGIALSMRVFFRVLFRNGGSQFEYLLYGLDGIAVLCRNSGICSALLRFSFYC